MNREDSVANAGIDFDLRRHVANLLADRRDVIVADTVATFPLSSGSRRLDADYCVRLGNLTTRLLCDAVIEGRLDSRGAGISELATVVAEREMSPEQLFLFVHIAMGTAIDELSLDQRVGAS